MKDPIRMRESHELPSALRHAFAKLGQDAPGAETVLRVQRALEALPATAPAAAGALSLGKLLVIATLAAGALTSLVMFSRGSEEQYAAQPSRSTIDTSVSQRPTSPEASTRAEPALAAANEAHRATSAEPDMPLAEVRERGPEPIAPVHATQPPAAITASGANAARRAVRDDQRVPSGQAAVRPARQTPENEAPSNTQGAQASSAPEPASTAVAQVDEAERLAQCKRLAVRDPAEALRQVEALAREVPHGTFVLERELLAIRLHERLGHSATAAQLTRRFVERYPSSVYRRALAP